MKLKISCAVLFALGYVGLAPASQAEKCPDAIQGKIAWNASGNTSWGQGNIDRLCADNRASIEPAECFRTLMSGKVSWGGGTVWQWSNAIGLCQGSRNASATISCFESSLASGGTWQTASAACQPAKMASQSNVVTMSKGAITTLPGITTATKPNVKPNRTTPGSSVPINPGQSGGVSNSIGSVNSAVLGAAPGRAAFEKMKADRALAEAAIARMAAERQAQAEAASAARLASKQNNAYTGRLDCDDSDPRIHPLQNEVCNNKDDNCDGVIDEGVQLSVYLDADGDGFGSNDPRDRVMACPIGDGLAGLALRAGDCNDSDATINPARGNCG